MPNITYEKIYENIKKNGYTLDIIEKNFPEFKKKELVNLKPNEAKSLIEYNSYLIKNKMTNPDHVDSNIKDGSWTPEMGEIKLSSDYKIWKGMRILKAIAESDNPIDVYVEVLDSESSLLNNENIIEICTIIKNAIASLFLKYNKQLPELSDEIWQAELPLYLKKLDILLYNDIYDTPLDPPTIISFLNPDRSDNFPDKICIINGYNNSSELQIYNCNLFPSISSNNSLILKPGEYKNIFSLSPDINGIIQCKEIPIHYPEMLDNKIINYKLSPFTFMRVSIPVQESKDGTLPVGVNFQNKEDENSFIQQINTNNINNGISYIIFDINDFKDN